MSTKKTVTSEYFHRTLPKHHTNRQLVFILKSCGSVEELLSNPVSANHTYLHTNPNSEPNTNPPLIVSLKTLSNRPTS